MRILVLGGTVFLSRAVAQAAVAGGHDVTCAARGVSGHPPEGATFVRWDRADPPPPDLGADFDAVVDVSGTPSHVRAAVASLPGAHWVFVSSISAYADTSTPGGSPATLPVLPPVTADEPSAETYGGRKVACEEAVRTSAASATVVRPGLIVGPGDGSGRFTYWPARFAEAARDGGPVLVPEPVDEPVQVVDVRDLATWLVDLAEHRTSGTFDAVCAPLPRSALLDAVAEGVGAAPSLVPVPSATLQHRDVRPWVGPRSLPLWVGDPTWTGFLAHDPAASFAAGLTTRPLADTARDTLAWLRATPDARVTGLTRQEERTLLAELGLG